MPSDRRCAEISIVLCYFQLCNEDYTWWWRSFLTSGSSGLYLFAYSIMYFFTQLDIIGFVPTLIYFTYMFVFATLFFLITGTIGFYSCYWFVWTIYGAIKVDWGALGRAPLRCAAGCRAMASRAATRTRGVRCVPPLLWAV